MKLTSSYLIIFLFLTSCQLESRKKITEYLEEKKDEIKNSISANKEEIKNSISENKEEIKNSISENKEQNNRKILYVVGDPYYIEGVKYIPKEDYNYDKKGLATYYGKELHKVKTANNDFNKVTELLGRHKTLPLPSIVKITNLENGFSLIIRINDRHNDNLSIIQVSRKVSQLLRFYKNKIARVRVEILKDASKQIKVVTESMTNPDFNTTIDSAPTESVAISDLKKISNQGDTTIYNYEQPIELGSEEISNQNLYLKVYGFNSYDDANKILGSLKIKFKTTTQNEGDNYSILLGPLENNEANKLVSSFISKGYKKTEIILE